MLLEAQKRVSRVSFQSDQVFFLTFHKVAPVTLVKIHAELRSVMLLFHRHASVCTKKEAWTIKKERDAL